MFHAEHENYQSNGLLDKNYQFSLLQPRFGQEYSQLMRTVVLFGFEAVSNPCLTLKLIDSLHTENPGIDMNATLAGDLVREVVANEWERNRVLSSLFIRGAWSCRLPSYIEANVFSKVIATY